jgi:hypothetical protein
MKKSIYETFGVTPEDLAPLRELPEVKRLSELLAKIEDGTASAVERAEFDERTKSVREMDPNVLKG